MSKAYSHECFRTSRSPKVPTRSPRRPDRAKASPRRHLTVAPEQQSPRKQLQFDAGPAPGRADAGASPQKGIDPQLRHANIGMQWSAACEGMWTPVLHLQSEIPTVCADDATQVSSAGDTSVSPNDGQESEKPTTADRDGVDGRISPISRLEASMASFGSAIAAKESVTKHADCRPW